MENNLYTFTDDDGEKNTRLETDIYAPLDRDAHELTKKIIGVLDCGELPDLDANSRRLLWQFYVYNAYKRHPNTFGRYEDNLDYEDIKRKAIASAISKGYDPDGIQEGIKSVVIDDDFKHQTRQLVRVEQSDTVLRSFEKFGVTFGVAIEGTSFVLPDLTFQILKPDDSNSTHIWIPIHPKYAVSPTGEDGRSHLHCVEKFYARELNEHWYRHSKTVLSTSQKLLISLANAIDGKCIAF